MENPAPYPELIIVDIDAIIASKVAVQFYEIERALAPLETFEPA